MADNGSRRSGGSGGNTQQLQDGQSSARPKRERQEGWSRGPRSLFLRRFDNNGFGFTLRHFIVYPPESYTVLQGDRRLGLLHGNGGQGPVSAALDEPMDTIFVKHVRENSSAHAAGLATGDRIISVNGETITGRTYAQVVQLIQQSGNFLHLFVVPKEDDILQLYFGETAHNPETNRRPSRVKSPEASAQHHRGNGRANMMRQQSPVPFSSLQLTSQQQQASSLPLPHHLRHHHRQHLTSQNQANARLLLQNPSFVADLQEAKTDTLPQTVHTAMPSAMNSSNLWSPQSLPTSGTGNQGRNVDRVTFYHGAVGEGGNKELQNFHTHMKSPSVRRNSEGNGPAMSRESAYGYSGSGRGRGDFRGVGGGNESNLYCGVPGNERRVSVDNSVWSRGSSSGAMYKLRQSEDVMGSAGGGLAYPNTERSRGLFHGQNLGSSAPLSDNSVASSNYGSAENVHLTAGSVNNLQRLNYSGTAGCRLSLDGGTTRRDSSVSLPSNGLVRDSYTASEGSKDSLVSFDSASTLTGGGQDRCSSDDSLIMSRIRKSFEQKEEFLKRPSQPISWNIASGNQQQPSSPLISQHAIIAREFYARPQKFQRPLWPPQNSGSCSPVLHRQQSPPRSSSSGRSNYSSSSSNNNNKPTHQNLQRVKSDIDSERDSLSSHTSGEEKSYHEQASSEPWDDNQSNIRGEFVYGGPVSNVPTTALNRSVFSQYTGSQFRPIMPVSPSTSVAGNSSNGSTVCVRHSSGGKGSFVTTLTRIHENIPVSDPGASGEHYTSAAFSDGAKEVSHVGGGSSSLPSTLPSSQPVAAAAADSGVQYPRSISTPSEGIGNQNPSHVHPMLQLVSKRARQFETGVLGEEEGPPNDRTSLYRSELSRLSSKRSVPNVAVRKREFESRSTSSGASGGARDGRRMNRDSRSLESAAVAHTRKYGLSTTGSILSGNRLIPVGSKHLHCEPPHEFSERKTDPPSSENQDERNEPVKLRARSNSAESWAAVAGSASRQEAVRNTLEWPRSRDDDHGDVANEPQRHKAVRQDSYLAAVRTPVTAERMARLLKRHGALPMDEHEEMDSLTPPVSPSTVPIPATPAERPNQLPIAHPLRPAEPQPVTSSPTCGVEDGDTNEAHDGIGKLVAALNDISPVPVSTIPSTVSSESSNVVTTASPDTSGVVRRQKNTTVSEEERLVRRVSYLKATWGDRMHVDSDLDLSDTESPRMQLRSSVIGTEPSTVETLRPECNKENLVREGWLHCKITLVDGKRAGDRSWKQVWAVLRGHILCLYKEKRDSQQQQQQHTPLNVTDNLSEQQSTSSAVDVRCSQVDIADNYTKKKHVLRLNTLSGSELLLQAEDADNMVQWIHALQAQANEKENCSSGGSSRQQQKSSQSTGAVSGGGNSRLSPLPTHKGIRKLTSFHNRSPTGQSPVNKTRKPSQTDQIPSPKTKTWRGRVAKQLRRIQQGSGSPNSPTAPHPEGVTIGIPLEDCPQSSFSEFVPLLVELCTHIVEMRGLDIIGIYRVPGNTAAVTSLSEGLRKGFDNISLQDPRWNDVNVISSLLKLFFRKLPDALLTSELYPLFIEADKIEDPGKRVITIKKLLHDLPDHHFETLKFLLLHLKKVVEHSTTNKMEARNLAIVFGPTLVRTADNNMVTLVTDMSHQCRIVESLISHVDWFISDDESDDFSNFPFSLPLDSAELEPAAANHNLLLSNIQKVEGMKADSPNKDISAKDIVSSIISAANRKMQKAKSRKGGSGGGAMIEDSKETSGEGKENMDSKQQTSESKVTKHKECVSAVENNDPSASTVASSIFESVVFSGNIVKSIHTGEEDDVAVSSELPDRSSTQEESAGRELRADSRSCRLESSRKNEEQQQPFRQDGVIVGNDEVTIRTYAGLSATTQERIRRFERETKAMLQRDLPRRRDAEWREAEKRRIEMELRQAKHDMESEDLLDEIADNPSDITKKMTNMTNVLERDKKCAVGDSSKYASSTGCRLSSSPLLPSSAPSNNLTSMKSEFPSSPFLMSRSNSVISSADQGNSQTSVGSTQNPVHKDKASALQKFTRTKKVGTTHIFPDSPKNLGGDRNCNADGSSSSTDVVAVRSSASLLPGRSNAESSSTALGSGGSLTQSTVAVTLPQSSASSQRMLRRGNSAENLHASVQQHATCRLETQKGAPPPNGTLKKLKTGKEQLELASPLLSSKPPSPLTGSLRCGSLDSLQEAYGSERPQSDISDDGGCFFSWTRKILAINKKISRQTASPSLWCFLSHFQPQATFISKPSSTSTTTGSSGCPINSSSTTHHHHHHHHYHHHAGLKFSPSEALGRLRRGSDLLVSLTSTFDQKLKSLLSGTTTTAAAATTVGAATDTTPATETNISLEHSKLLQENEIEENGGNDKSLPVSAGGSSEMSKNNLLETSAIICTNEESISVQPTVTFTPTYTALFRDPSLHRRKSTPDDYQGQKDDVIGKDEEEQMKPEKQDNLIQGRSRESSSVSPRQHCPHLDQKSLHGGKNYEKENGNDEECVESLKNVTRGVNAIPRPKSIDSVTKLENTESSHSTRLKQSESLTKCEKEEGSSASVKLKHSESLTKADKQETAAVNSRLKRSESLTKAERCSESALTHTKLKRSESLSKAEKTEALSNTRLRRSESLTKAERSESPSNSKLKRSDSLTKTEKTESNISKRRQQEMLISGSCIRSSSRGNKEKENIATLLTKLKRKNVMAECSIKRRHTVGGTKDFDKLHWLDNRLQHEQLAENEAANAVAMATMNNKERRCLRTSSPDLSSSRLNGVPARDGFLVEISLLGSGGIMAELRQHLSPATGRPHSLPDPNLVSRAFKVPLESHV
ncbi:uncharacterized protein LOC111863876 isoform X5 [Cryptotermes secundus]|uniref:uncharacterized protein LOC111863876 isoform X5 n=1 Tax=Cryptotermes secundus TaxID=105785 RepID=UPI001454B96D|nr:uncharacterized protein LOC111863876 isoform X5 [Cryptotermes secundus]